jgi:hypothetical protein
MLEIVCVLFAVILRGMFEPSLDLGYNIMWLGES